MKAKWYFGFLLATLTLFGICQEQSVAPNQEIVLNFANEHIDSDVVLETVKSELQGIAENVRVVEDANGRLKITYYSSEAITTVKEILSSEKISDFGFSSIDEKNNSHKIPSNENLKHYNFDVFEIQKSSDSHSGFGGKFIIEYKQDLDRSSNPNLQPYSLVVDDNYTCNIVKATLKTNKVIAIAIDNTSHNIPEVRAGPTT